MSAALLIVLFVLFGAVVIGLAVLQAKRAKARRVALAAVAAQRGWSYAEQDQRWVEYFDGFPFGTGHRRTVENVVTGRIGERDLIAFDYCYRTTETSRDSNGNTTRREVSHPYGVVGVRTGVVFPELEVDPEGIFSRMVGRLTGHDIELESEDFNRAFTVHCPDRRFASDVLHPQQMEYLLTRPDFQFRFTGDWVLTTATGKFELPEIDQRLDHVSTVIGNIPDFVWKDVRS